MNVTNGSLLVPPVIPAHPQATYGNWLAGYPLRSFLELGAYKPAAGSARGHVRNVLAEWGLGAFTDAVAYVMSEMIVNAIVATEKVAWEGGRPPVRLWLLAGPGSSGAGEVMVLIWDAVRELPEPREADEFDESGRGLAIVDALCGQWDCYLAGGPEGGKVTRALVSDPWRDQSAG
jgi:hypothetical protein